MAIPKMTWISWRHPAPEAPIAGRDPHERDREDVEDALDEDRPERPAQRGVAVDPQEVGPIQVTELGRDDAVDQPRQVDDLGGVLDPDPKAGPAQQDGPAQPTQREAEVEHDEGDEHERRVHAADERWDLGERLVVEPDEHPDDGERDEDRDDRLRLTEALAERDALGGILDGRLFRGIARRGRARGRGGRVVRRAREGRVQARTDLHGTGPYRLATVGRHRPMVLPVGAVHRECLAASSADPPDGRTRPLPRSRWTPFAIGVQRRTT